METNHENSLLSVSSKYPKVQVFQVRVKETKKKAVVCSLGINKVFPDILNLSLSVHCHNVDSNFPITFAPFTLTCALYFDIQLQI